MRRGHAEQGKQSRTKFQKQQTDKQVSRPKGT